MLKLSDMQLYSKQMYEQFILLSQYYKEREQEDCYYFVVYEGLIHLCDQIAETLKTTNNNCFKEASIKYGEFIDKLVNDIDTILLDLDKYNEYDIMFQWANSKLVELYDIYDSLSLIQVKRSYI